MILVRHSEPPAGFCERAFTLIEIVVALTIIAVISAVAIPTLKGLDREEKARVPMKTLAEMVLEVRERAMRERRPYQIVFEHEGIHASPAMYPYEKREDFLEHFEEMRTPPPREVIERVEVTRQEIEGRPQAAAQGETPLFQPPWTVTIPLEEGTECEVLMWGDGEWDVIEGDKMRRWVFQPTGMANPARVRLHTRTADLEAGFDLLTGEMVGERTRPIAEQP